MNTNSNAYTFVFMAVLAIAVSILLASTAEGLKPFQKENIKKEKMQNILASVGIKVSPENAQSSFDQYIVNQIVLDGKGDVKTSNKKAFDVDVLKEYKSGLNSIYAQHQNDASARANALIEKDANYPLFVCKKENGTTNYIIPVVGKGLWGPIWGYVALEEDKATVSGTTFDHKTETPGLGAEINQAFFQVQWVGKKIFDNDGNFTSVKVLKGGNTASNPHGVDAISGGTITSNGVSEMVERTLSIYEPYLKNS